MGQLSLITGWCFRGVIHPTTRFHVDTQSLQWSRIVQCVPCLIVPLHVNNDTRAPPSSCQSLSAWVGRQQRRKTEAEFHAFLLLSSSDGKKTNDRSGHLNAVPSRLTHSQLSASLKTNGNFPTHPGWNSFTKSIHIKGTRKNHVRFSECYSHSCIWWLFSLELTHPMTI